MWGGQIIVFIGILIALLIGRYICEKFNLVKLFILPQTIGILIYSLFLLTFSQKIDFSLVLASNTISVIATLFLVTLGINIGIKLKWRETLKEIIPLLAFIVLVYIILYSISSKTQGITSMVFNPFRIGWSEDTIKILSSKYNKELLIYFLNTSFIISVLSTPIYLLILSRMSKLEMNSKEYTYHFSLWGLIIACAITFALSILMIFEIPFIYKATFAIIIGIVIGSIFGEKSESVGKNSEWLLGVLTCATFASSLLFLIKKNSSPISTEILKWVLLYFIATSLIHLLIAKMMKKGEENFVYIAACWALLSSSPLACMNVLKSASHNSDNKIVYIAVPILANIFINIIHLLNYLLFI